MIVGIIALFIGLGIAPAVSTSIDFIGQHGMGVKNESTITTNTQNTTFSDVNILIMSGYCGLARIDGFHKWILVMVEIKK